MKTIQLRQIIYRLLLVAFIVGSSIISYFNSASYITNQEWKYSTGFHLGDWLSKNTFEINDRVFQSNKNKGKIVFSLGKLLIIKDVKTGEKGYYSNKSWIKFHIKKAAQNCTAFHIVG